MKKKSIDLSIIILNYNAKDFLIRCIQSIESSNYNGNESEIIVVDNASRDGSVEALRKLQKEISFDLIVNKDNLGFSKGNNVAVPQAKGRYLLFLNPDTEVKPDTLSYMIKFMNDHQNVGGSTCKLVLANGELDEGAHRGFPTPWNAFCHFSGLERFFPTSRLFSGYTLGYLPRSTIHEIDAIKGAFMFVRREAGEQVEWWDEDYFWYGEDIDFSYKLKQKGWKIMYVPTVTTVHYWGVSSGVKKQTKEVSIATTSTRKLAARASTVAMRIFYKKHYEKIYPIPVIWLVQSGIWLLEQYRLRFW